MKELENTTGLEIAVIGMACRFPGANNLDEFWNNLRNGINSISYLDENEIKENVPTDMSADPNYVNCIGGVIENKEMFDANFFNYSSIEATLLDPQVRIFHECVYHALNNGGYDSDKFSGLIGLYGSASLNTDWLVRAYKSGLINNLGQYASTNYLNKDQMCLHVSYKLNLRGPSIQINTSCSSSLVAIHMAAQALLNGECDMAIAGGVSIASAQPKGYVYQDGMINSKDGKCCAFDASASGTISGEGCGVVLLKPLEDALKDRDNIYGIIKGSFVNNDGKLKLGYTSPSIEGQSTVIKEAHNVSEVNPESITYIEAHGTGTIIGDPIEFMALNKAFSTEKRGYCAIGAVKTNIGHLDAGAGVAGFIKTMLALRHKQIPPLINFTKPNPKIDLKNSPFYISTKLSEWNVTNFPRRAGVSSFGIGGTNAHIIVEEANFENTVIEDNQPYIFSISAKSKDSLINNLIEFSEYLAESKKANCSDICHTMHLGRKHLNFRYSFVIENYDDLTKMLNNVDSDLIINTENSLNKDIPVVFMFSGQGSQYVKMGLQLYHNNLFFKKQMDECFQYIDDTSKYKEILYPSRDINIENINNTEFAQPLLFIIEYSLSKLLMHYGVKPTVLVGHSIGEYVAACLAGVFSLNDALFIVKERGKIMQEMPGGAMLSVPLKKEDIKNYLSNSISLAADNSSSLCVLSGDTNAINACADKIYQEYGVECTLLNTSHAFHSHTVDSVLNKFRKVFDDIEIRKPRIPIYQNVTGEISSSETNYDVNYWCNHLRNCVLFNDSISTILENEKALFIEVGPGTALARFVENHDKSTSKHIIIKTLRHINNNIDDNIYLLNTISKIWSCGIDINWELFYSTKHKRVVLPNYSFQKQKYWIDEADISKVNVQKSELPNKNSNIVISEKESSGVTKSILKPRPRISSEYIKPTNELEQVLSEIFSEVLGFRNIGINDNFFELGGDSLLAVAILGTTHKRLESKILIKDFFSDPTIKGLAKLTVGSKKSYFSIRLAEKKEYYVLSPAEERIFITTQLNKNAKNFNSPIVLRLNDEINNEHIESLFNKLINIHENLRTSFSIINGQSVKVIHENVSISLNDLTEKGISGSSKNGDELFDWITNNAVPIFSIDKPPLMHICKFNFDCKIHLLIDYHHIISDAITAQILNKDIMKLLQNDTISDNRLQYKDYTEWFDKYMRTDDYKKQRQFWLQRFKDENKYTEIPTDYPRPIQQRFEADTITLSIIGEFEKIKKMVDDLNTTTYSLFLTYINILLYKYSGNEYILIGTETSGRRHIELNEIAGMFVGLILLKNSVSSELTFKQLVNDVTNSTIQSLDNQDYQFNDLVKEVNLTGENSTNQVFNILFGNDRFVNTQLGTKDHHKGGSFEMITSSHASQATNWDLRFGLFEKQNEICLSIKYAKSLYKHSTCKKMSEDLLLIINNTLQNPLMKIAEIQLDHNLSKSESNTMREFDNDYSFDN